MDILSNAYISTHFESRDRGRVLEAYEFGLAKAIFEKLWEHYPSRDWKVKVDAHPSVGIVSIKLPRLHHSALGYNFPIDKLAADPDMKIVVRAGGELLERFRLTRGRFNKAEYRDQVYAKRVHKLTDYIDGGLAINNRAQWVHGQNRILLP